MSTGGVDAARGLTTTMSDSAACFKTRTAVMTLARLAMGRIRPPPLAKRTLPPATSVRIAAGPITTGDRTRPAGLRVGGRGRCVLAVGDRWTGGGAPSLALTGVRAMATLATSRTRTARAVRGRDTIPPVGGGAHGMRGPAVGKTEINPGQSRCSSSEVVFDRT